MPQKVEIEAGYFSKKKASVFECLRDLGAYRFKPKEDFRADAKPANFAGRIKDWARAQGIGMRVKVENDGSVTAQAYELTDEDKIQREASAERARRRFAGKKLAEAQ